MELLLALVHPLTLALILFGGVALDLWLIDRPARGRPAPPPDTP